MRKLRASELGSFNYCERAWWYEQQNLPSANQAAMDTGSQKHREHSRTVKLAAIYRWLALALLAVVLFLIFKILL